jgi:hypothetical protein
MWWTVNIRNGGMGEAEIKIRSTNTFRGSRRYVRRLQRRYMPNPHLEPDEEQGLAAAPAGSQDASLQVGRLWVACESSAKQRTRMQVHRCLCWCTHVDSAKKKKRGYRVCSSGYAATDTS